MPKERAALTIYVDEALNIPPALWVRDSNGHKREIWDPNPQFHAMQFGLAEPYQWRDADGGDWSGILVKPVGYVAGPHYPLVLQMYDYVDGQFITDGLYPTAFAARELASVGSLFCRFESGAIGSPKTTQEFISKAIAALFEALRHKESSIPRGWASLDSAGPAGTWLMRLSRIRSSLLQLRSPMVLTTVTCSTNSLLQATIFSRSR